MANPIAAILTADAPRGGRPERRRGRRGDRGTGAPADPARRSSSASSRSGCGSSRARRRGSRRTCERCRRTASWRATRLEALERRARRADRARQRRRGRSTGPQLLARPLDLDLNALMRRRGASELRTVLRAVRLILRRGAEAATALAGLPAGSGTRAGRPPVTAGGASVLRTSVVIPVKDGARYLGELLAALAREGRRRGAGDRLGLARRLGRDRARGAAPSVLEIAPDGVRPRPHAQPRRRAHLGRADLLPDPGRDAGRRAGSPPTARRSRSPTRVGAAFGPHLPRPDTSPMIARELTEFFAGFAPDGRAGRPAARRPDVPVERQRLLPRATAGSELRFPDVALRARTRRSARDARRRLGARSTTRAPRCCTRTTTARSSSCGATSTSTAACARRSATSSRFAACARGATSAGRCAATARWMRERGLDGAARARAGRRARRVHHAGRKRVLRARLARRPAARRGPARALARGPSPTARGDEPRAVAPRPSRAVRSTSRRAGARGPGAAARPGARPGRRASGCTSRS